MKIYGVELLVREGQTMLSFEELKSKAMSCFNDNDIIDAIALSSVVISEERVSFIFKKTVVVDDV